MDIFKLVLAFGIPLSVIACIAAFIITYSEYERHFTDRKKVWKISLESSIFTFIVFIAITIVIGIVISKFL